MSEISVQRCVPAAGIPTAATLRGWAMAALEAGFHVVGLDSSRPMLDRAERA